MADPVGSGPVDDDEATSDGDAVRRRPRWLLPVVIGVLLVAIGTGVVLAIVGRSDAGYDDATRARFLDVCVADGGEPVRPACECLYAAITEQIPYDRFVEVDSQLRAARAAGDDVVLPDDIAALVPACQVEA